MRIAPNLIEEMVSHAREDEPNECCGMIGGRDGAAATVYRARNAHASPLRYEVDPRDQIRIVNEIEEAGEELVGIYHSHTRSEAYPSQTDINLAENWPGPLYLIVSLANPDAPEVRAFSIRDGAVDERELVIE